MPQSPAPPSNGETPSLFPLRPQTFGELLDAAVSLLRLHPRAFLIAAMVLAGAEQALLYPLRVSAGVDPPFDLPYTDRLPQYWLLLCVGLATEAAAIALLGGLTARAAGPALMGRRMPGRELFALAGSRLGAVIAAAAVVFAVTGICALALFLPWIFAYGLLGLLVPALVIDRRGFFSALWRSLALSARFGLRGVWIRLGGYFSWLAIRIALTIGALVILSYAIPNSVKGWWLTFIVLAAMAAVNAVAYASLACLDAVLLLETRMRAEGLDITLGRMLRRGEAGVPALAVRE